MAKYAQMAKRLQGAINKRVEGKLVINTQQWYSEKKSRPITLYILRQEIKKPSGKGKTVTDLFRTYSQIQMLLFLRDYWFELNGWEVPTDNPIWEEVKKRYGKTGEISDVEPDMRGQQSMS